MDSQRWWSLLSKNYSILNLGKFFHSEKNGFLHNMLPPQYCITGPRWVKAWMELLYLLLSMGPFYLHGLTLIPVGISNYVHYKVWDKVTYPFSNFNSGIVEVWKLIHDFIPHFTGHVIMLVKAVSGMQPIPYLQWGFDCATDEIRARISNTIAYLNLIISLYQNSSRAALTESHANVISLQFNRTC